MTSLSNEPFSSEQGDSPCKLAKMKLEISPKRICFLKFILEAYDGLALLSTLDAKTGLVQISYYHSQHDVICSIVESLELN